MKVLLHLEFMLIHVTELCVYKEFFPRLMVQLCVSLITALNYKEKFSELVLLLWMSALFSFSPPPPQ